MEGTSWRSGLLLVLLGGFLVSRSVWHDDTGRTLVDRILGKQPGGASGSGSGAGTAGGAGNKIGISAQGVGVSVKHLDGLPIPQLHLPHLTVLGHKLPNGIDQINQGQKLLGAK